MLKSAYAAPSIVLQWVPRESFFTMSYYAILFESILGLRESLDSLDCSLANGRFFWGKINSEITFIYFTFVHDRTNITS